MGKAVLFRFIHVRDMMDMDDGSVQLQALKSMDAEALREIFELYAPAIYKYAFRHCGNAILADNIVGDVFEKLMEQLSQGRGPSSNIRSYLFETAYHAMVDEFRHVQRMASMSSMELHLPPINSIDTTVEDLNLMESIWRVIQCDLTEDQRHVIILRFLDGFSLKEIASIMGRKVSSIKVIQHRAVGALRRKLDSQTMKHKSDEQDRLIQ